MSQLRLADRRLIGIENVAHGIEENYIKNDKRSQNALLEAIVNETSALGNKQEQFAKGLKTGLREINQKQDNMNKYLPKCKSIKCFFFTVKIVALLIVVQNRMIKT